MIELVDKTWRERALKCERRLREFSKEHLDEKSLCVAVMGSFARKELAPHSDADILLIVNSTERRNETDVTEFAQHLHATLPHGSVVARTNEECAAIIDTDLRSWLSLLESRPVYGDVSLHVELMKSIRDRINALGKANVLRRVEEFARERHRQYGESVRLLEPNIKNSAGCLRDVQFIYYYGLVQSFAAGESVSRTLPELLSWILYERVERVQEAWSFFLSVREIMHEHVGYLHDILEYELQKTVAHRLNYGEKEKKETVERFMSAYYLHAGNVDLLFNQLFLTKRIDPSKSFHLLDDVFLAQDGVLSCTATALTGDECLRAFLHYASWQVEFDAALLRILDARSMSEALSFTESALRDFDAILRSGLRVGRTLRRMNELRLLGKILPEFEGLVAFFQHNVYHYYTADEHTIIALENAERLADEESHLGDVFRAIEDRSLLYYAILFHDVAKPVDLAQHEIVGAEMTPKMLVRFGREDIAEDVTFLVRNHLQMEQTAFRRNIHDRFTLLPFAQKIATKRRLDLLYILTYADMSAVNPSVWTNWKSVMLRELYERTRLTLPKSDRAFATRIETGRDTEQTHMSPAPSDVDETSSVPLSESRIEELYERIQHGEPCAISIRHRESWSEVTLVCRDAPYLLSRAAAAFLSADAAIISAQIFTRDDEIAVDTFRVYDIVSGASLSGAREAELRNRMHAVLSGLEDTDELFRRYRKKWKRKLRRSLNPATRIDVEYHGHVADNDARQTIIDVFAPDTYGLLYQLTRVISSFGLTIRFATIATVVDGVVDSFYVTGVDGSPFDDVTAQERLRSALIEQITVLTGSHTGQRV